jgi:hypothetical protein
MPSFLLCSPRDRLLNRGSCQNLAPWRRFAGIELPRPEYQSSCIKLTLGDLHCGSKSRFQTKGVPLILNALIIRPVRRPFRSLHGRTHISSHDETKRPQRHAIATLAGIELDLFATTATSPPSSNPVLSLSFHSLLTFLGCFRRFRSLNMLLHL